MNNILIVVGLPCSGKTTLANKIIKNSNINYILIDDPKSFEIDILPHIKKNIIITDPNLCFEENRNKIIELIKDHNKSAKIDWLFFENDPEQCLINSKKRLDDKKIDSFIKNLNTKYNIPKNSNVISVYK